LDRTAAAGFKGDEGKLALHPRGATWTYSDHAVQKKKNMEGRLRIERKAAGSFKNFRIILAKQFAGRIKGSEKRFQERFANRFKQHFRTRFIFSRPF
jgi:hypothetical protein